MKRTLYTLLAAAVLIPGLTFAHPSFAQVSTTGGGPVVNAPVGGGTAGAEQGKRDFKGKHERMEKRRMEKRHVEKRRVEKRHEEKRRHERREVRRHERHEMKK